MAELVVGIIGTVLVAGSLLYAWKLDERFKKALQKHEADVAKTTKAQDDLIKTQRMQIAELTERLERVERATKSVEAAIRTQTDEQIKSGFIAQSEIAAQGQRNRIS